MSVSKLTYVNTVFEDVDGLTFPVMVSAERFNATVAEVERLRREVERLNNARVREHGEWAAEVERLREAKQRADAYVSAIAPLFRSSEVRDDGTMSIPYPVWDEFALAIARIRMRAQRDRYGAED